MQLHNGLTREFYARPAAMTSAGRYAPLFDGLPRQIAGLAAVAQGLLVHEHVAAAYGVTLSDEDRSSVHLRPVQRLLERIVARDDRRLGTARAAVDRIAGNCRHFTLLMVAMLRAQGTPARARCGFGGYFVDGLFEDHWVCEYWNGGQERWILVDAQIDDRQRAMFPIDFDVTDVPRDRFLIAGNLMRDAAALRSIELLPWDTWGAMPTAGEDRRGPLRPVPPPCRAHPGPGRGVRRVAAAPGGRREAAGPTGRAQRLARPRRSPVTSGHRRGRPGLPADAVVQMHHAATEPALVE